MARGYAGDTEGYKLIINSKTGKAISGTSLFKDESEVLFKSGTSKFKILAIDDKLNGKFEKDNNLSKEQLKWLETNQKKVKSKEENGITYYMEEI